MLDLTPRCSDGELVNRGVSSDVRRKFDIGTTIQPHENASLADSRGKQVRFVKSLPFPVSIIRMAMTR